MAAHIAADTITPDEIMAIKPGKEDSVHTDWF
jgi:hypothetical protein